MEIIGMGILLAVGFYLAPVIITLVIGAIALVFAGVASLFK